MKSNIPIPSVERLSILYTILERFEMENKTTVSSAELGQIMGVQPNTLRKDISHLGQPGKEAGYNVATLKTTIESGLGINIKRKACIVGLGQLGSAIINFPGFIGTNITIEAGFDSNINKLETFSTEIPLYPAYRIEEIVKYKQIDLGILAVPPSVAQLTADRMIKGGIKGILNLTPVVIKTEDASICVRNIHILEEIRILSAMIPSED